MNMKNAATPFSCEEKQILWDNVSKPYVNIILILIYTSFRPNELFGLKKANVDLENKTIVCKSPKWHTSIVPIHKKIYPLIKELYEKSESEFLVNDSLEDFKTELVNICKENNMKHQLIDTRITFLYNARLYGLQNEVIQYLMGTSIKTYEIYNGRIALEEIERQLNRID